MAVIENGGSKIRSSGQNLDNTVVSHEKQDAAAINGDGNSNNTQMQNGFSNVENGGDKNGEILKNNMSDLVEILSKLNPMAEEFVPPSLAHHHHHQDNHFLENGFEFSTESFVVNAANSGNGNGYTNRRKRNNYSQGNRRLNNRTNIVQREDAIRKTVYVSDLDVQVTVELLAGLFRVADRSLIVVYLVILILFSALPLSSSIKKDAKAALNLSETVIGYYPLKVMPSKTAITPVNPTFLPRSEDEREMRTRTIYCTNIDKKVTQANVKIFFESVCGEVQRLKILGDYHHSTHIAFVEFTLKVRSQPQLQWCIFGITAHKGKPIKDTHSSSCCLPCNALNHSRLSLSPGPINC